MENTSVTPEQIIQMMNHSICRRVMLMHTVLTGYSLFDSIQTKKGCANSNITYKDAEYIAERYEEITGVEVKATDFLHDKNELANELLDDYQKYHSLLENFDETIQPIVNAYYHHLFYKRRLHITETKPLLVAMTAFINYVLGTIDRKELKNSFIMIDLVKRKSFVVDSMYARHNFISLEKEFNDICIKRANRALKKSNEGPYSNFTINITM